MPTGKRKWARARVSLADCQFSQLWGRTHKRRPHALHSRPPAKRCCVHSRYSHERGWSKVMAEMELRMRHYRALEHQREVTAQLCDICHRLATEIQRLRRVPSRSCKSPLYVQAPHYIK